MTCAEQMVSTGPRLSISLRFAGYFCVETGVFQILEGFFTLPDRFLSISYSSNVGRRPVPGRPRRDDPFVRELNKRKCFQPRAIQFRSNGQVGKTPKSD